MNKAQKDKKTLKLNDRIIVFLCLLIFASVLVYIPLEYLIDAGIIDPMIQAWVWSSFFLAAVLLFIYKIIEDTIVMKRGKRSWMRLFLYILNVISSIAGSVISLILSIFRIVDFDLSTRLLLRDAFVISFNILALCLICWLLTLPFRIYKKRKEKQKEKSLENKEGVL